MDALPLLPAPRPPAGQGADAERSDAARNRQRILDSARALLAEGGADSLTMDCLAQAAGVGKGTIFRRFGTRAGLLQALLDTEEQALQHGFLLGPPPLGPGAPPEQRLAAFGTARIEFLRQHGELQRAADRDPANLFGAPPRHVDHTHLAYLLRELGGVPEPEALATALLAVISAPVVLHQVQVQHLTFEQVIEAWAFLVHQLCQTADSSCDTANISLPRQ
ncbi:TetR/AcrR family transcriptional regulator [Lolliginicoccus levis]|uniref:TetR/AcrR family transcriptional regulator n=1 Tax=Lolliginicoccus levis TaxID=2919542 RepID=UPI00241D928F|nr:TetR/AcrR family transcriptional regulator [Lolliginicoccus levis]